MTTPDAAREYLSRGWQPIPVPHRSKKPALKGWPDLRLTAADLARHFNGQPSNLGILLGEPSGGLVDADLDCAEALYLAPAFLPPTGSCFGRTSKRRSHWLYVVTTAVGTKKFVDSDGDTTFVPVFESRSRFRQVSYAVTDQQHPATSTRLKHAAESSLKHPEHDHVKREPGGPSPDERKLQNNGRRRGRRFAHPILAPTRARGPRGDGLDPADLSGPRPSPARASRSTLSL